MSVNWDPLSVPHVVDLDYYCPACNCRTHPDEVGYSLIHKEEVCPDCLEEQCVTCDAVIDEVNGDSWWFNHGADGPYCDDCAMVRATLLPAEMLPQELTPPSVV